MIPPFIHKLSPTELVKRADARKLRGVFQVEADHYHAGPGLSSTGVKKLLVSPAHFMTQTVPTDAMRFGTALHMAVLEPERFAQLYACAPNVDRRTKEGKAEYQEFLDNIPEEACILTAPEWKDLAGMVRAMGGSAVVRGLLQGSVREVAAYKQCRETGVLKKAMADILADGVIADVKTCLDATPEEFTKTIFNYGYHISAAWYLEVFSEALGVQLDTFMWIAIEKKPPYGLRVYVADKRMLDLGRKECLNAVEIYRECQKSGVWPAYPDEVTLIDLPEWVYKRSIA